MTKKSRQNVSVRVVGGLAIVLGLLVAQKSSAAEPYRKWVRILQRNLDEASRSANLDREILDAGIDLKRIPAQADSLLAVDSFDTVEAFEKHIAAIRSFSTFLESAKEKVADIYAKEQVGRRLAAEAKDKAKICDWQPYYDRIDETLKQARYADSTRDEKYGPELYEASQDPTTMDVNIVLYVRGHIQRQEGWSVPLRVLEDTQKRLMTRENLGFLKSQAEFFGIRSWQAKRDSVAQRMLRESSGPKELQAQLDAITGRICQEAERIGINGCYHRSKNDRTYEFRRVAWFLPLFTEAQGEEFKSVLQGALLDVRAISKQLKLPSFSVKVDDCQVNVEPPDGNRRWGSTNVFFKSDQDIALGAMGQVNDSLMAKGDGYSLEISPDISDEEIFESNDRRFWKTFFYFLGKDRSYACTVRHHGWERLEENIQSWLSELDRKLCSMSQAADSTASILSEDNVRTY